jgi:hypothetical protein
MAMHFSDAANWGLVFRKHTQRMMMGKYDRAVVDLTFSRSNRSGVWHRCYPRAIPLGRSRQLSSPNTTMSLTEGPLDDQARYLLQNALSPDQPPDETTLLLTATGSLPVPYRRGILGKRDRTLDPMIPPGSIVQIDTQKRVISSRKDWTQEFRRPVYFLMARDTYVCGWCELDKNSEWLTLVPHPLSATPSRRWKYRTEIENLGRVVGVAIRLAE